MIENLAIYRGSPTLVPSLALSDPYHCEVYYYSCMSVRHVLVAALPIPNSSFDCLQYAKRRRIFDNQFPLHSCIYTESDKKKKLNSCKRLHNWATLVSHETQELALNHHVQNQGWYRLESEPECTCSLIPRLHCGSETSE